MEKLSPFVKWTGGKSSELGIIKEHMPEFKGRYIEPFLGGGAVFFAIGKNKEKIVNDKSEELMELYRMIKEENEEFYNTLKNFDKTWKDIRIYSEKNYEFFKNIYKNYLGNKIGIEKVENIIGEYIEEEKEEILELLNGFHLKESDFFLEEIKRTFKRRYKSLKKIELNKGRVNEEDILDAIEVIFKSSFYIFVRYIYNNLENLKVKEGEKSAVFYFIREYCYSSMFRYNKKGEFNVPYGGISYNKKNIGKKMDMIKEGKYKKYLENTRMYSLDFEEFFKEIKPEEDDFIFLDPPYDSEFNSYANMEFERKDQERLAKVLGEINGKFMMIIKNTDFIYELYKDYNILMFDKNYSVNFHNRNDREVEHLLIKNY